MADELLIQVSPRTRKLIDTLKIRFGVESDGDVLTRALGLASTAIEVAGDKHVITLRGEDSDTGIRLTLNH